MKLNINPKVRVVLYVVTAVGTPLVAYLASKEVIGDLEVTLWSSEVAIVSAMAGFKVDRTK